MSFRRLSLLVASLFLVAAAGAASAASPSGKDMLPALEGRWTDSDCAKFYFQFKFKDADKRTLEMTFPPQTSIPKMAIRVEVEEGTDDVSFVAPTGTRTKVRWIDKNTHETTDVHKDGKVVKATYKRCPA